MAIRAPDGANKTAASGLGNQTSQRLPDFGNG